MEKRLIKRSITRKKRVMRVRKKIKGSSERPRLVVVKTNQHLYAQIIDDEKGVTIAGFGTISKQNRNTDFAKKSKDSAKEIGKQIALLAKERKVESVVFDRGRYKYHGLIADIATGAREAGLQL